MAYELRVNGRIKEFDKRPEEALDRVRALIRMGLRHLA